MGLMTENKHTTSKSIQRIKEEKSIFVIFFLNMIFLLKSLSDI